MSCATVPRQADGTAVSGDVQVSAPPMQRATLDNGLQVIVVENHTVPLVTIEIAVRAGAYAEPREWDGLMHFYEHMFFKGNKAIPDQSAFMKKVRELGINFNGVTSDEAVRYYFTLPRENLEAGLEFMYDAITAPLFDPAEMEKEKGAVLAEIDRSESEIGHDFVEATEKALYGPYYYRKNVLGDREVIRTATPEIMRAIQQRYYIPNNSALIIAGDVQPEKAQSLARGIFASWASGPDPYVLFPVPKHVPLEKTVHVMDNKPVDIAQMRFMWQGPSVGSDPGATYAADVLSVMLSQRSSGFLQTPGRFRRRPARRHGLLHPQSHRPRNPVCRNAAAPGGRGLRHASWRTEQHGAARLFQRRRAEPGQAATAYQRTVPAGTLPGIRPVGGILVVRRRYRLLSRLPRSRHESDPGGCPELYRKIHSRRSPGGGSSHFP